MGGTLKEERRERKKDGAGSGVGGDWGCVQRVRKLNGGPYQWQMGTGGSQQEVPEQGKQEAPRTQWG